MILHWLAYDEFVEIVVTEWEVIVADGALEQ